MPAVRTTKHLLLESTAKSVESGNFDVICQFCTVKGMVAESEVLKAQSCALSKLSLTLHSNVALIEATALTQPHSEGEFVLDTDASGVAIPDFFHARYSQGPLDNRKLRPIVFGSKKLTSPQAKYCAPKLEMYAAYYFILRNHSSLCPRKFTLRVDNQALVWLKTYSLDQATLGARSWP